MQAIIKGRPALFSPYIDYVDIVLINPLPIKGIVIHKPVCTITKPSNKGTEISKWQ
jgi:hypothetical protein